VNRWNLGIGFFALGAIVVVLAYRRGWRASPPVHVPAAAALSEGEKNRIRQFWSAYRAARALMLEGRWEAAVTQYHRALALDPRHEDSLYNMANCHFELDQFEQALVALERLVEVNPLSHRGYLQTGIVRACPQAGPAFDLAAAEEALLRAFEINKEETGALLRLGEVALVKGDEPRAFKLLALANRSNFRAVEGYYLRAYLRWKESRLDESRELLAAALEQIMKPVVRAEVPGEGDTRPDHRLPPPTAAEKSLIKPLWSGLAERHADGNFEPEEQATEFARLDAYLTELRAIVPKTTAKVPAN